MKEVSIFWFRRDLRLIDNLGLYKAITGKYPVIPLFIFDTNIINSLEKNDSRITLIYKVLCDLKPLVVKGDPKIIFLELIKKYNVKEVYFNKDFEPYGLSRDRDITVFLENQGVIVNSFLDHLIFEPSFILKNNGEPYTVFTPYKNKWLKSFSYSSLNDFTAKVNWMDEYTIPSLEDLGFIKSEIKLKPYSLDLNNYEITRDRPCFETSNLGPYLRFGLISIREIFRKIDNPIFISELIWREFFTQIIYHYPWVIEKSFREKYELPWLNKLDDFNCWIKGETGYPMVDAGMRELFQTGYMHNRVRMICAGFLCKHLLIDWRWGEKYFASKLLDYELASNNGNWQWSSGTGCDAAPYFRVFNPQEQQKKFDKDFKYIKKWIPEFGTSLYPKPIIDHKKARERVLDLYKKNLTL